MLPEAIGDALAAGDFALAADLINQTAAAMFKQGELTTLHAWLTVLPHAQIESDAALAANAGWLHWLMGQGAEAVRYAVLAEQAGGNLLPRLRSLQACLTLTQSVSETAVAQTRTLLDELDGSEQFFRNMVLLLLAEAQNTHDDVANSVKTLRQAMAAGSGRFACGAVE